MHLEAEIHSVLPLPKPPAIGSAEITQLRIEFAGEGIDDLVKMFEQEGPENIERIAAAVRSGDANAMRRAAHQLKGAAANFGAHPLQSLCEEMEQAGRAGDTVSVSGMVAEVRREYRRVEAALSDECRNKSSL